MKNAPLVIILLIGLGMLGYIFVNKQNNEKDLNTNSNLSSFEEESTPITSNNNQTQTNTNTQTPPGNQPVTQAGGSNCAPNDQPSVTLISPNGGETYNIGQQMEIVWENCNVGQNSRVFIDLYQYNNSIPLVDSINGIENTGSTNITLSNQHQPTIFSGNYEIHLSVGVENIGLVSDESDGSVFIFN